MMKNSKLVCLSSDHNKKLRSGGIPERRKAGLENPDFS